ncbi:hypothetical protein JL722_11764 [Aureococcus anophagefferens]|nr:hypothetical protein JL722_11764 [Aureococcus anophagefferens]
MFDSGLDGWTDAFFSLYSESGDRVFHATLDAGATGTERFCLADGCLAASVNGDGLFPEEVSWTLGDVTGGAPTEMSMLFSGGDVQESCSTELPTRAPSSERSLTPAPTTTTLAPTSLAPSLQPTASAAPTVVASPAPTSVPATSPAYCRLQSTEACWGNTHRFRESRLGSLDTALDAAFAFEDVGGAA